jgi:cobalt-zinc-cadmium efflux system outer membrane protein
MAMLSKLLTNRLGNSKRALAPLVLLALPGASVLAAGPPRPQSPPQQQYSRWPREVPQASAATYQQEQRSPAEMVPAPLPADPASGQQGLTCDQMIDIALSNNPTVRQAGSALEAAQGNWVQVGLYPNPGIGYLGNQIGDRGTAGQQGAYWQQEFVRGGKLQLNREVAEREVMIARQNLAAQRQRVVNDVRIHFYNTLIAQRMLEITRDMEGISKQALSVADQLFNAQQVGKVDVLQARIESSNANIRVTAAQNRLAASWRQLAAVSAVPGMQPQTLVGDLNEEIPEFTWEQSIARILQESPELGASRTNVGRAAEALRRARVEPVPNVTVQASPQYDIGANHTISNVSIFVPVPLFDYNQGNIRKAEADLRGARSAVARHELLLTSQLSMYFERYRNAQIQYAQFRDEIMPDAKEALDLVGHAYRQGETSFLVLLNAQRTYFFTVLAGLDAQRDLWETAITIDGLLLTDNLQTGPMTIPETPGVQPPSQLQLNPLLGH